MIYNITIGHRQYDVISVSKFAYIILNNVWRIDHCVLPVIAIISAVIRVGKSLGCPNRKENIELYMACLLKMVIKPDKLGLSVDKHAWTRGLSSGDWFIMVL